LFPEQDPMARGSLNRLGVMVLLAFIPEKSSEELGMEGG